jgi:hypothetical protein
MSPRSKKEYTEAIHKRYKHASRSEKKLILDEFCATSGYHRKYAIMLLKGFKRFRKAVRKKRGPKPLYRNDEIIKPLKKIWLAANLPCSKRLKVILPLWLPGYAEQFGMLPLDIVQALRHISPATIDRLLKPARCRYGKRGRSTTKPGTLLRRQIPIAVNQWDESRPLPPGGQNNERSGEKGNGACWSRSLMWNGCCPFRYSVSIVTMVQSF